ncbi:hypothetical protein A9X01_02380 [Mycobacterium asiaticum]|uniref:AMP-binding enzyme C-terminal domain-containing protein n=1 Tax=Mycobacterium asiaticum TaxID=1790 RepID=A0A1A3BZU3_MYCAS|nr:hypothetical protein A9X01_02380 [Mycobacterium asiaticum]
MSGHGRGVHPLAVVAPRSRAEAPNDGLPEHLAEEFAKRQLPDRFELVSAIRVPATGRLNKLGCGEVRG